MVGVETVQVVHAFRVLAAPGTHFAVVVGVARGVVVVGYGVADGQILLEGNTMPSKRRNGRRKKSSCRRRRRRRRRRRTRSFLIMAVQFGRTGSEHRIEVNVLCK